MDAKGKKRIVIWVSVAALLGVGGYFAYTKVIKPKLDEMKAKKAAEEAAKLAANNASTPTPSSGSAAQSGGSSSATLTTEQVKAFQNWMDNTHPNWVNGKNLNGGAGYGNFGTSTKAAFSQYGAEWASKNNYVAAGMLARSIGAPTFVFQGKTYDTKTGRVYVPPAAAGEAAIGKIASPKGAYANIRNSASAASGFLNNTFIGQINSPNAIGKITNLTIGDDGKRWYYVSNLLTPLSPSTKGLGLGIPSATKGWVREDQITIK